uniref:Uncharacterized protein n=1 Tax=uncultured Desulfobacterium sp. TaxID=201089 RepID=E1YGA6_9BACT|nr:unknown protein [uncultured Desulfobacterium sp.]
MANLPVEQSDFGLIQQFRGALLAGLPLGYLADLLISYCSL